MGCNRLRTCCIDVTSTCVRVCFGAYSLICAWLVTASRKDEYYWLLSLLIIPIVIEATVSLSRRHHRPSFYRWFSPSIFLFLLASLPSLVLLEWDYVEDENLHSVNLSWSPIHHQEPISTTFTIGLLEQSLLALLIGGRLFLLQGELSTDRLLLILLHQIVTACDILEINEIFRERSDAFNYIMIYCIIAALGLSILQFSLQPGDLTMLGAFNRANMKDLWLLCAPTCLVESCFLGLRVVFIFLYGLMTYPLIFYAAKNIIAIIIECSLLFSVLCNIRHCLSLSSLVSLNSLSHRRSASAPTLEESQHSPSTRSAVSIPIAVDSKQRDPSFDQSRSTRSIRGNPS